MSSCQRVVRPLVRSLRQDRLLQSSTSQLSRPFSKTAPRRQPDDGDVPPSSQATTTTPPPSSSTTKPSPPPAASTTTTSTSAPSAPSPSSSSSMNQLAAAAAEAEKIRMKERLLDPNTTTAHWAERKLVRQGTPPIGSRRRRAAIRTSQNLPFEQLPYQCFQEARAVLAEDRQEKIAAIRKEVAKIRRLEETPADKVVGGERVKIMRLISLRKQLERYKILADINDPIVKRRFEDGLGDMNKPIYRYLAEQKWRGYPYRLLSQRISQLNIVPDVLPKFEPVMDVQLYFRRVKVEPGEIMDSRITEVPPRLRVQCFDPGERLVSIVVLDSDVPNAETDSFERRLHYLAVNVPLSPANPSLPLGRVDKAAQLAVPWLPAFSQKGAPYHRLSVFLLEQTAPPAPGDDKAKAKLSKPASRVLDIEKMRELYGGRDGFSLKSFRDKFGLRPVGFNLFRTVWDEGTAAVMKRAGVPGADVEFKHKRVYSLKPDKKARGWEAKRQKPKYRGLWKYSKRIHGLGIGRRRR